MSKQEWKYHLICCLVLLLVRAVFIDSISLSSKTTTQQPPDKNSILPLKLKCEVNYIGTIKFKIFLPEKILSSGLSKVIDFYYSVDNGKTRTAIHGCTVNDYDEKAIYVCDMPVLTHPNYLTRAFSFSMYFEGARTRTKYLINDFLFPSKLKGERDEGKSNTSIMPWYTKEQFTMCNESFGTRYIGLAVDTDTVNVTWIRYPLTVDFYSHHKRTTLSIEEATTDHNSTVEVDPRDVCTEDTCFRTAPVHNCKNVYSVCIETVFSSGAQQKKCREIRPYCSRKEQVSLIDGKEIILIAFGGFIIIVSLAGFVYMRYRHCKQNKENNSTIYPRNNMNYSNSENVYSYPVLRKASCGNDNSIRIS